MNSQECIVIFDGNCNLCNRSVNFIIQYDPNGIFKFASSNSKTAKKILNKNSIENLDSLVLIENNSVYIYSTAVLRIVRKLKGLWKLLYILIIVPRPIRDFLYKTFARYRYKLFGQSCPTLTTETRRRFLP